MRTLFLGGGDTRALPSVPLDGRSGDPQSRGGHSGQENNSCTCKESISYHAHRNKLFYRLNQRTGLHDAIHLHVFISRAYFYDAVSLEMVG